MWGEMRRGRGVFEGATRICDVSVGEEGGGGGIENGVKKLYLVDLLS